MHALAVERPSYDSLRLLQSLSYAIAAYIAGFIYDRVVTARSISSSSAQLVFQTFREAAPEPPRMNFSAQASAPKLSAVASRRSWRRREAHLGSSGALAAILMAKRGIAGGQRVPAFAFCTDLRTPPSLIASSATAPALFELPVTLHVLGDSVQHACAEVLLLKRGCHGTSRQIGSWIGSDHPMVLVASRVLTG